ncbi:MAG: DUF4340 domain-containing protein [Lentisphaeria bacterium]|nr:DUF4340 domain-containing protein [Lentisphaeria bacterium]
MKQKQFLILIVAAVVLVALGLFIRRGSDKSWSPKSEVEAKVLADFDVTAVAKIEVTGEEGTVVIAYKDKQWRVEQKHGYPAKFDTLRDFLMKLRDLKAAQTPRVGEKFYGKLGLLEPGKGTSEECATLVNFYDEKGAKLLTLFLGKEHKKKSQDNGAMGGMMGMMGGGGGSFPDGRYIRVGKTGKVVLVSETFGSVKNDPTQWLDKEFFKISDVKEATLSEAGKGLWKVRRETKSDSLELVGAIPEDKEVDTGKLGSIKSAFGWASFTDVADPNAKPEETGLDTPRTYKAVEFGGTAYTIRVGKKNTGGKYFMTVSAAYEGATEREAVKDEKPEDKTKNDMEFAEKLREKQEKIEGINARTSAWVYLVNAYTVENVLKKRGELLKDKPKPEPEKKDDDKPKDGNKAPELKK